MCPRMERTLLQRVLQQWPHCLLLSNLRVWHYLAEVAAALVRPDGIVVVDRSSPCVTAHQMHRHFNTEAGMVSKTSGRLQATQWMEPRVKIGAGACMGRLFMCTQQCHSVPSCRVVHV
jgi:hypothetical protein